MPEEATTALGGGGTGPGADRAGAVDRRPSVLILAETCNPEWPSLPVVGFKYAREIAKRSDAVVVTHIRNRPAIERAGTPFSVRYIDTEWLAAPIYKLAQWVRGGTDVAWSTSQMMAYLPYLEFERAVLSAFRSELAAGRFDLVHRITPMSPTLPSYAAKRLAVPFVIGPLNGNLDWPAAFAEEQKRERERMRVLRPIYKLLPYARSTYRDAAVILAAFRHTRDDLPAQAAARMVDFPEIGFDETLFHPPEPGAPRSGILFAGRLVPYKLPEVAIRSMLHPALAGEVLHIVGDGPDRARLEAIVAEEGLAGRVILHGRMDQAGVAGMMRTCRIFAFPSIRELGAGVVVEAMASGMVCVVADYGAPGALVGEDRGWRVPLADRDAMVGGFAEALRSVLSDPSEAVRRAEAGRVFAFDGFTWAQKAVRTLDVYQDLISGRAPQNRHYPGL